MPQIRFDGRLESDKEAHFIRVPAAVLIALGPEKRAPVTLTINGYTYGTRIAVYSGQSYLGVRREIREAAGIEAGDQLTLVLEYDAELRTVELPDAVRSAVEADAGTAAAFDRLSYTRKKELVEWVTGAKRPETQRRRMAQAMAMLRARPKGR
jgi:8-oxo-dGTP pyrophosphatase MutT (NUDIX family)